LACSDGETGAGSPSKASAPTLSACQFALRDARNPVIDFAPGARLVPNSRASTTVMLRDKRRLYALVDASGSMPRLGLFDSGHQRFGQLPHLLSVWQGAALGEIVKLGMA